MEDIVERLQRTESAYYAAKAKTAQAAEVLAVAVAKAVYCAERAKAKRGMVEELFEAEVEVGEAWQASGEAEAAESKAHEEWLKQQEMSDGHC